MTDDDRETPEMLTPDPIDAAVAAVDQPRPPVAMRWDAPPGSIPDGAVLTIVTPVDFTTEQFEAAVAVLVNMRAQAVRRQQERELVVARQRIVGLDGRPIQ